MTYYNTLYYKSLSLELTDCDTCKKRHCKYYLCECDKKILEKNYKYNYQIKKHKRYLRCNKAYSNGKGVYCLNGHHDDCDWKVKQYFKIIEARAFQNKELYNKVVEELNKYMLGGAYITYLCEPIGWRLCEDPCSICEQNGHSFSYWYFSTFFDLYD